MLDIRLIRENPETVKENLKKRFMDGKVVDELLNYDLKWRETLKKIENLRHKRNKKSNLIAMMLKEGRDVEGIKNEMKKINEEIKDLESRIENYRNKRDYLLMRIPNLIHSTVPVCEGEENSEVIRSWGRAKVLESNVEYLRKNSMDMDYEIIERKPQSHVDIIENQDMADIARAAKIAGSRFYYLKNKLVILELSLIRFALDFLVERGFIPVSPPLMIHRAPMEGVTDFSTFEEMIYKIEGEDLYLIATAEHPLVAMHMNEILSEEELPKRYVGISPCFRKEAGAHGKDTKGIFRVHNFYKVEMVIFSKPEESWKHMEELIGYAEEITKKLGIPHRVVNICSGELGAIASKKYDIEAWMPAQQRFREIVSCSNCTDYQARRLGIRMRRGKEKFFVHTLNSTALATTRMMVAIIENFQEDGKIRVPNALQDYTGFEFL